MCVCMCVCVCVLGIKSEIKCNCKKFLLRDTNGSESPRLELS